MGLRLMNHDEGNPIAGEVEYSGLNDSVFYAAFNPNHRDRWLFWYLSYVEFLND